MTKNALTIHLTGQQAYLVASDDNASFISEEDRYKFCDDLSILEIIMLADILIEYDFREHVASDVGVNQKFLSVSQLQTQENLDRISLWTQENLMKLKESKTDYQVFTRTQNRFATRFTLNGNQNQSGIS